MAGERHSSGDAGHGKEPAAQRSLHESADSCLVGGSQLLQREGGRPHASFVEVRLVHEAERRVPRVELLRALEEADDLAVLGKRGHPVPESRREGWRAGFVTAREVGTRLSRRSQAAGGIGGVFQLAGPPSGPWRETRECSCRCIRRHWTRSPRATYTTE